jgi:flagellar hook-associated protein 2
MSQSITGLASGLDTASIIDSLVSVEKNSINIVSARKDTANLKLTTWSGIKTQLQVLKTASQALLHQSDWTSLTATSSNESIVGVSAGSGTLNGTLTFRVDSLASAGSVRSANVLSSTTANVAADLAIFVAAKGQTIGFASFASDNALALGKHDIRVTQSSAAAVKLGGSPIDASTTIAPGDTITFEVNGSAYTLDNIAPGTYNPADLAAAIQTAATAKGAAVNVSVDPATNALRIASSREGSDASIQVTGGTALAKLHLSVDGAALHGTDGKVQIDDAPEQTFTSIDPGQSVTLNAATGSLTGVFSGGLRAGTITGNNVSVGDGSLATVVQNINAAGAGVTATAVQVGQGAYRLQINSNSAGADAGPNIAASEFNNSVGSLVELTKASDAQITVGEGAGAYTVTSDSNTVSGVLPGVTLQLKSKSTDPVTVTVSRDVEALADKVQKLVDAANKVRAAIDLATAYDAENKKSSPLTGDATARRMVSDLNRAITDAVPFAALEAPGLVGVSVDKDGKYSLDRSKFVTAFNADPAGVTKMFTQGGSATDASVSFVSAGDRTKAGTYDVEVTALATQASAVGLEGTWPIGTPPTVKIRIGTKEIAYSVQPTDTQADVVAQLNSRLAQAGLQLQASESGTGIKINTTQYGHAATFEVAWDGATYESFAGTDVAGKINGKDAIGSGQQLSMAFDDPDLGGLALNITSTTTGPLGTFTYNPGIGQRVSTALTQATDALDGYLTSTENALKKNISFIEDTVESMNQRLVQYQARLKTQFATLETTLSTLKNTSAWLGGQIAGLNSSS